MAGRGTDIKLGGNKDFNEEGIQNDLKEFEINEKKVKELGGLFIIGTEHESRRIDNQLRGDQVDKVIRCDYFFISYKMN